MTSRRSFLKATTLASAGLLVRPSSLWKASATNIGLQLYTVRDAMQADPAGTLRKVAKLGFTTVEGATYTGTQQFYGMDAKAFAVLLKQQGLAMPSSHYMLGEAKMNGADIKGTLLNEWDKAVDDAAAAGIKYMVCAYLMEDERGNLDRYKQLAERFNKAAEVCKKAGIQFCYHNHDFEFQQMDGQRPYDILLRDTDKDLVKMEMDIYWVKKAGLDPVALMKEHKGRFPLEGYG
jgi:sugar phosphate isomerase/epimerase